MAGRGNLRGWFVGDGGEGRQGRAVAVGRPGPQAGGDHVATVARAELQDLVLSVAVDVLVEGGREHHAMGEAEHLAPGRFQLVAARVVGSGVLSFDDLRPPRPPALVAHRSPDVPVALARKSVVWGKSVSVR